jgi:hypothetical protein
MLLAGGGPMPVLLALLSSWNSCGQEPWASFMTQALFTNQSWYLGE